MQIRKSVLGEEHVNLAEDNKSDFDADFQRLITEVAWGSIWAKLARMADLRCCLSHALAHATMRLC